MGGPGGGAGLYQDRGSLQASNNVFTYSLLSFSKKLEELGQTRLLFQQQQWAVDTFPNCFQEERVITVSSRPRGQEAFVILKTKTKSEILTARFFLGGGV